MGLTSRRIKLGIPYWFNFFFLVMMIHEIVFYRQQLFIIFEKCLCLEREWDKILIFSQIFCFACLSAAAPKLCIDIENILKNSTHAEFLAIFIAYSTQKKRFNMFAEVFIRAPLWQAKFAFTAVTEDNLNMHAGVYISIFYLLFGCSVFLKYSTRFLRENFVNLAFIFIGSSLYDTTIFWEFFYKDEPDVLDELKNIREIMRTIENRF